MENNSIEELQNKIKQLKAEQRKLEEESLQLIKRDGGSGVYSIRPAGRHVLTIGEDLIQDQCAAITELVKNAYDADSPSVNITFTKVSDEIIKISVIDHGHGMTVDDIVYKWLVPSTDNKIEKRISPKGRIMQGRKGVGRYAASILGNNFKMNTVTENGVCNTVEFEWSQFSKADYLDQVDINVISNSSSEEPGTMIVMTGDEKQSAYWNEKNIEKLKYQLKRLLTPEEILENSSFKIYLGFDDFYKDPLLDITEEIKPFPILELFDYRISGKIDSTGNGILTYECQKVKPTTIESIPFSYGNVTNCGELIIDIRVFDRDGESLDNLITRGLNNAKTGKRINRTQAKQLINTVNGIGVYRNGFRIRPLGDPDYDWLTLNQKRIQNPSMKIGGDQVSGYVHIQSEELSHLEEKSARDGLKENDSYESLKTITLRIIEELERRRYVLRRQIGQSKSSKKLEKQLDSLYDYTGLKKSISRTLKNAGLTADSILVVEKLIDEEEKKNNNTVEEIRKAVALYQGQATLGKVINVVLHEGRRPLNYFKTQLPNLEYYDQLFEKNNDSKYAEKIVELSSGIESNAQIFVKLFSKIDPLASRRRQQKKEFHVNKVLSDVFAVFQSELNKEKIEIELNCDKDCVYYGWEHDFYIIFTNLVDNSIYWMTNTNSTKKSISVEVTANNEDFVIYYRDTGPGISKGLLESGVIFEPDFSTKLEGGSGLGLAIAGEASERNGLVLSAEESEDGAFFIISKKES